MAARLTVADRLALLLSLLAVAISYWVTRNVFEEMAHLEDEIAYVWQAEAIAQGHLTVPSPPAPKSFLVPFVVDYEGQRFGKYPLGWPVLLAIGVRLGVRSLINPLLAGFAVWLTYRLGKRLLGETVGVLAAGLTVLSPFFLMNSGSLLSHPLGLALSAGFALAWIDAFGGPQPSRPWLPTLVAAGAMGLLALTRPLTAVGLALPFAFHGLYLLVRGDGGVRRRLIVFGLIAMALASLLFLWQYAVTGDPLLNPYTLWWEYDKVGFGPGVGLVEKGHNLRQAWINTRHSLRAGAWDFFGWGPATWGLLALGLLVSLRRPMAILAAAVFPSLVVVYLAYWIGSWLFGPRYYYEGFFSVTLMTAAAIAFLAGWPVRPGQPWPYYTGWRQARPLLVTALLALAVVSTAWFYIPQRVGGMHNLYGIERADLAPFLTPSAQELAPALIVVDPDHWTEYGALLALQDPFLEYPFLFIISRGSRVDLEVAREHFPDRNLYFYYPEEPYTFYTAPLAQQ